MANRCMTFTLNGTSLWSFFVSRATALISCNTPPNNWSLRPAINEEFVVPLDQRNDICDCMEALRCLILVFWPIALVFSPLDSVGIYDEKYSYECYGTTTTSPLFNRIFCSRSLPRITSPYRKGMARTLP